MKFLVRVATLGFVIFVVIAVASCSSQLKLSKDMAERSDIRQEYLHNNPDGQFNDHIVKSEVVKGMNVIEVLASWGLPDLRRRYKDVDSDVWTYYTVDKASSQIVTYDLVFEDRALMRWVVETDVMSLEDYKKHQQGGSTRISTITPGGLSGDTGSLKRP